MTANDLKKMLIEMDHKGYPQYKRTKGSYKFPAYTLGIDHVQGDPFAAPSSVHVEVEGREAGFPVYLYDEKEKRIALQDYLIRMFEQQVKKYSFQAKGSGKSGLISVTRCGQEILERSACCIDSKSGKIIMRFEIGFPANGRTINAKELIKILFEFLPKCVEKSLLYRNLNETVVEQVMELAVDQRYIRTQLKKQGLVAFVADGSVLPRESGVSSRPMKNATPFQSPDSMRVSLTLPYKGSITGMGIPKGITLIVGGGYHGKSTLLKALESGVYCHVAGDGREYVITDADAVKVRAEDGRSIKHTDISMFINDLPNQKSTKAFYTEDASGSTSQAANVVEAMEAGASVLLIDEDTSATNFMVRDELMQRVIHRDMEPITPLIERMKEMYEKCDVSTILVAGSCGTYFEVADIILQMDHYVPKDITALAKDTAKEFPGLQYPEDEWKLPDYNRKPKKNPNVFHNGRIKIKTMGTDGFMLNHDMIDLRYVEQLVDTQISTCLGHMLKNMEETDMDGKKTLRELIDHLYCEIEKHGFEVICGKSVPGNLAMPRRQEMFACMNRYRGLNM